MFEYVENRIYLEVVMKNILSRMGPGKLGL